jgi:hypothetical protein
MYKFGEFPRSPLQRDKELQEFFASDLDLYEKAVTSLANGYGIGAFAYFRRLLENHILSILDKVQKELEETGDEGNHLAEIEQLRQDSRMNDKIKIANRALPNYLVPQGTNPLGRLYQVLSVGVHSLSEDECLEKAKGVEAALRYLVSELRSRQKRRREFKIDISWLQC